MNLKKIENTQTDKKYNYNNLKNRNHGIRII